MFKKSGGELEHALRSRCIEPRTTEEYINALEDTVTREKIGRIWKNLDIKSPNKPFIKKDNPRETFKPTKSNSNEQRKLHKCGERMKETLIEPLFEYKNSFATDKEPLGSTIVHEVDIILNVEKPYPPQLRRPAYPASPSAREDLEVHIK
ncbi:hypothetical protein O181_094664 [Austropuccinia psidii MF-1]|uniref:Uncharacterized protein n=1 Tax=Austropuccinia psidii MF-1 TaxID=1389203 RepID=A0A9Q3J3V1_9BASI|nr:hypothetical protein [Austropuccinia psidii MF-1]